jgi:3'(2'), 5'-bisphosphate nucleotidase
VAANRRLRLRLEACDTPHAVDLPRQGIVPASPAASVTEPRLLDELTTLVARAAAAILAVAPSALAPRTKVDQSPVTAADEAAQAVIVEGLARLLPGVPVVAEEGGLRPEFLSPLFVLVDPLDGTREFIAGRPEFTVNVALIADRMPVVGVIAGPALGRIWRGCVGRGAERLTLVAEGAPKAVEPAAIRVRPAPSHGLVAALSRSHFDAQTEAFIDRLPIVERTSLGSSAKFCLIAEGSADVYPRLSPTCEWDIAAGHAVLAAAGGAVLAPDGQPISFGQLPEFRVPAFVAWGDTEAARRYRFP